MHRRTNRHALSTVVGATFFVVLALLSLTILSWQINVFDQEFAQARIKMQTILGRFEEDAEITTLSVASSNSKMNATIANNGIFLLQLVGVWITEYQTPQTALWHKRFVLNQRINPGRTVTNIGQELSQTLTSTYTYVVKFVTANGNILVAVYSPINPFTQTGVSTTGYLFFTFSQNTFMMTNATQTLPVPAWTISPGTQNIVWYVKVSNHGLYDIKLYKYTVLSLIQITPSTSVTQTRFYIVHNTTANPTPSTIQVYTDLSEVIPANPTGDYNTGGTPQWVFFSGSQPSDQQHLTQNWPPQSTSESEFMIFMIFYYKYGNEDLTQVIPFVGIHVL